MRPKWVTLIVLIGGLAICSGIWSSTAGAATYYVSSLTGNDDNPGSFSLPFQTIGKVNSLSLSSNDSVLFKCGDTWRAEQLAITKSGISASAVITFGSYPLGCANKPILSGAQPITGWAVYSGSIYVADLSAGTNAGKFTLGINQLFKNGQRLLLGRWPNLTDANGGYSTIDSHTPSGSQITDNQLPAWVSAGAMVHIRTERWSLDKRQVTGVSGKILTLNSGIACDMFDVAPAGDANNCTGWGFFVNNHLGALDVDGEWYYDAATNRVYLNSTSGVPANIEGSVILEAYGSDYMTHGGIMLGNTSTAVAYIVIDNLELKHWFNNGISTPLWLVNTLYHDIAIRNMSIKDVEATGIFLETYIGSGSDFRGGYSMEMTNNLIDGANYVGINAYSSYSTIQDNVIKNIGLIYNFGKMGAGCGVTDSDCGINGDAIRIRTHVYPNSGHTNTIQYNRIERCGFSGIDVMGSTNTIQFNFIKEALYVKGDGGSIRVWGDTSLAATKTYDNTFTQNIIIDSIGNSDGVRSAYQQPFGMGMVIDGYSRNITTTGNTIINATIQGMFYNLSTGNATYNTIYNAPSGTLYMGAFSTYDSAANTQVNLAHNIFYHLNPNYPGAAMFVNNSGTLPTSDYNYFFNPYFSYVIGTSGGTKTLAQWRTYSGGKDMNSKANWFTLSTGAPSNSVIFYNDTKVPKSFSLGATLYRDLDNQPASCSLTLQPFTSKVLLNFGETASCPSYLLWTK